jgi:hypothetical protein
LSQDSEKPPTVNVLSGTTGSAIQRVRTDINIVQQRVEFFPMTRDRLENELLKNHTRMTEERGWHITGPLFVVILLALVASDFQDKLGVPKAYWFAIFAVGGVLTGIHCIYSWYKWRSNKPITIEELTNRCLKRQD